jgi:cation-transporting ATPase 13A1
MAPLVDNAQIKSAELLRPLPLYQHAYVWPFAIAWPVFLRFYLSADLYDKYIQGQEWTFVWLATIITLQALVWLCTHWSVHLNALFTARKARSVEDALLIKVIPVANAGAADICKLVRDKVQPPEPLASSPRLAPLVLETDGLRFGA